jgi:cytidylate kinase
MMQHQTHPIEYPFVVALDGPAGSGKSSISKEVARRLGWGFLDTGAAYRALAWHAIASHVDTDDAASVVAALDSFDYRIAVARVPEVRRHLIEVFRAIIAAERREGIVVEGRDITTVVAPDAPVRILLTASEEVRMARRSKELVGHSAEATGAQLRARDRADSKVVDFMNAAEGVVTVDSTDLDFDATVEAVVDVIRDAQVRTG